MPRHPTPHGARPVQPGGEGSPLRFGASQVTLELSIELRHSASASAV
ncbi:trypco2 family protein [Streptomyces libani]